MPTIIIHNALAWFLLGAACAAVLAAIYFWVAIDRPRPHNVAQASIQTSLSEWEQRYLDRTDAEFEAMYLSWLSDGSPSLDEVTNNILDYPSVSAELAATIQASLAAVAGVDCNCGEAQFNPGGDHEVWCATVQWPEAVDPDPAPPHGIDRPWQATTEVIDW